MGSSLTVVETSPSQNEWQSPSEGRRGKTRADFATADHVDIFAGLPEDMALAEHYAVLGAGLGANPLDTRGTPGLLAKGRRLADPHHLAHVGASTASTLWRRRSLWHLGGGQPHSLAG